MNETYYNTLMVTIKGTLSILVGNCNNLPQILIQAIKVRRTVVSDPDPPFTARTGAADCLAYFVCIKPFKALCRLVAVHADQNREQYLQIDRKVKNRYKNTPVSPFSLETQGFYLFRRP